jgi:hypothetical protein
MEIYHCSHCSHCHRLHTNLRVLALGVHTSVCWRAHDSRRSTETHAAQETARGDGPWSATRPYSLEFASGKASGWSIPGLDPGAAWTRDGQGSAQAEGGCSASTVCCAKGA